MPSQRDAQLHGATHGRREAQLQSVTCTDGLKWPTLTPVPRIIAWIALGVDAKRANSAAADGALCSARVSECHTASTPACGPPSCTRWPLRTSGATAKETAGA